MEAVFDNQVCPNGVSTMSTLELNGLMRRSSYRITNIGQLLQYSDPASNFTNSGCMTVDVTTYALLRSEEECADSLGTPNVGLIEGSTYITLPIQMKSNRIGAESTGEGRKTRK